MRRAFQMLSIAVLAAGGCDEVVGNGQPTQQTRTLDGFTQVVNHGSLDVQVTQGSTFQVVVNADSNLVPLITTSVAGGVLSIGTTQSFRSSDTTRVDVALPSFEGADNQGSGTLAVIAVQTQAVALRNDGSGSLSFSGGAGAVSVSLSGSGATTLSGAGASLDGTNSGSGSLDASQFLVGEATLSCNGSGDSKLNVNGNSTLSLNGSGHIQAELNGGIASFSVSGSGSIDWTGSSTIGSSSVSGSGSVTHH